MAVGKKISGKAITLDWGGVTVPVKSYKPKFARGLKDTTDSTDYDATSKLLGQSQIPVSVEGSELSVEGYYYKGGELEGKILAAALSGDDTVGDPEADPVVLAGAGATVVGTLKSDDATSFAHASFDVESVEFTWETSEVVGFTLALKLSGVWHLGAAT